jgi:hypothetical protein
VANLTSVHVLYCTGETADELYGRKVGKQSYNPTSYDNLDDKSILLYIGVEGRGGTTAVPCHAQEEKEITTDRG